MAATEIPRLLEHISALIRLGLPLKRGISSCGSEVTSLSRRDLEEIENQLGSGTLLGDALACVPYSLSSIGRRFFSFICLLQLRSSPRLVSPSEAEVLRMGERSGDLQEAIRMVLHERERSDDLSRLLRDALIYPVLVFVFMGVIASGILVYIVPKFQKMFAEFDVALPTITLLALDVPL